MRKANRTHAEACAYSRGYYAGTTRAWPIGAPPQIPNGAQQQLADALRECCDAIDSHFAVMDPDDRDEDFSGMERARYRGLEALEGVCEWLREGVGPAGTMKP